ncbi:hypothetical protein [Streptomyces montanisoli]|uniref:Uncharacterized protein n=1 Tax=Streptomyces montanisoli TaxID=2798581 RepID=A0A940MCH9_9ACTN|nr:hypothetical protein [Streptomyces montanisoli]MBP0458383.1 hypothetical protein [Streptomyces montanisoli]
MTWDNQQQPTPDEPTQWGQQPEPQQPKDYGRRPGWTLKRFVIPGAAVLFFVGVAIGTSGGGDSATTKTAADAKPAPVPTATTTATETVTDAPMAKAKPAPTVTVTATATKTVTKTRTKTVAPKAAATIPGDGTFVVGSDIKAGTYKTSGPADSGFPSCYWARLKGTSGDFGEILANGNPSGQTTVTIRSSDKAFQTTGCSEWKKVG